MNNLCVNSTGLCTCLQIISAFLFNANKSLAFGNSPAGVLKILGNNLTPSVCALLQIRFDSMIKFGNLGELLTKYRVALTHFDNIKFDSELTDAYVPGKFPQGYSKPSAT